MNHCQLKSCEGRSFPIVSGATFFDDLVKEFGRMVELSAVPPPEPDKKGAW
jgi:hypothetical protein